MSVRRAFLFSLLDRYAGLAIGVVSSMVLARLLTPQETGTFSVAMSLLAFAAVFRDLGAGQYLLQERDVTDDRVRAVWAVQLGLGTLLAVLALATAYPASVYFREPALVPIFMVLALNYLVNPFGSITFVWLMRDMRFGVVAFMRTSTAVIGAVVSISLAWNGYGAISLAWGALAGVCCNSLMAIGFRPKHFPWMPGLRELRRVLGFGSKVTGSGILMTLRDYLPELIIARTHDLSTAGFFSRATGLMGLAARLVMDASFGVLQALFAKCYREGSELAAPLLRGISYVAGVGWALIALVAVLAEPLVLTLYGEQWHASVAPARWLALGAAAWSPVGVCVALLLASGGTHLQLRLTALSAALAIFATLLAAPAGIVWTSCALASASVIATVTWLVFSCQHAGLACRRLLDPLARSLLVTLLTVSPALAIVLAQDSLHLANWVVLVIGGAGGALAFLAALVLVRHPLRVELQHLVSQLQRRWGGTVARGE